MMADGRYFIFVLCLLTCAWGQWQKGLYPPSENGFSNLFEAVRPLTLHVERTETVVEITVHFRSRVHAVPHWVIENEEQSDEKILTLGKSWNKGIGNPSSVGLKLDAPVKELNFHLSSSIGDLVLELNFQELKNLSGDIYVPDIAVRPLVPAVYRPLSDESSCTEQYIYVKFEKASGEKVNLGYGRHVSFHFEDEYGTVNYESDFYYNHFLEKRKSYYGMEIELRPEYILNGSEVWARYRQYNVNDYIASVASCVHSLIEPPHPVQYVIFHDSLSMFLSDPNTVTFSETIEDISINCAAFGYPKPVVQIYDQSGNAIPVIEISLSTTMTTHVIGSLAKIPANQIFGDFTCRARSGKNTIEQVLTVRRKIDNKGT